MERRNESHQPKKQTLPSIHWVVKSCCRVLLEKWVRASAPFYDSCFRAGFTMGIVFLCRDNASFDAAVVVVVVVGFTILGKATISPSDQNFKLVGLQHFRYIVFFLYFLMVHLQLLFCLFLVFLSKQYTNFANNNVKIMLLVSEGNLIEKWNNALWLVDTCHMTYYI